MINLFSEFNDHDNYLLVLNKCGTLKIQNIFKNKVLCLNKNRGRVALFSIIKTFNKVKPNIIISTIAYFNFIIMIANLLSFHKPNKIILRESNIIQPTIKKKYFGWIFTIFYRILYNRADYILCNSREIYNDLISVGVKKDNIKILPNLIDEKKIKKNSKQKISRLTKFKNPHLPQFIIIGRLVNQKGVDKIISYFFEIKHKANLLIIGEGPCEDSLKKQVKSLGLNDYIYFLRNIENPHKYLLNSKALLIGSRWEGFPNVALESIVLGVPIITTQTCGGLIEFKKTISKDFLRIAHNDKEFVNHMEIILSNKSSNKWNKKIKLPVYFQKKNVIKIVRKIFFD